MSTEPTAPIPASLPRRLAAMFYDSLLLIAVLLAATALWVAVGGQTDGRAVATGEVVSEFQPLASGLLYQLYLLAVSTVFFGWFWQRSGQTLGMQAWRLRVDNLEGGRLSWKQCLLRVLAACLSLACLGMGYWWALLDKQGRSWHDHLSGSRVVLLPESKR